METIGSLVDKLSINELKVYHIKEQLKRTDVSDSFLQDCSVRLHLLIEQTNDLCGELRQLMEDINNGRVNPRPFRQLKMYNEKRFIDPQKIDE